jgi:hypothetical protein
MTIHREGSRRQKVHQIFDAEGDAAAFSLGRKLKLKDSTIFTWLSKWRTETVKANLAKAKAKKAKAKAA